MEKVICTKCETSNKANIKYCINCGFELPKVLITPTEPVKIIEQKSNKNTSKLFGLVVGGLVFIIAYWGIEKLFFDQPVFDKDLMTFASELNKTCPVMIDSETRLDNTIALPPNTVQYNYTLISVNKNIIDTTEFKSYLEPSILNQIKTNPQMKIFRDKKVTMNYLYKDKIGEYLFLISISPDKYDSESIKM